MLGLPIYTSFLANAAFADTVFYCNETQSLDVRHDGLEKYKLGKFKFQVNEEG